METRLNLSKTDPAAYKAMMGLVNYLAQTGLNPIHGELIKIRASQINGCAFCLDMHTKEARQLGETEQRIYTLNAWRDTAFFSREEQAILALTEEVTLISQHVKDVTYKNAVEVLGEKYVSEVIMAIVTINAWNRIAISTNMQPPVG